MKNDNTDNIDELFGEFMKLVYYYNLIDDIHIFRYTNVELNKILNSPFYSIESVEFVEKNMPYSFGIEMFFKDDLGFYTFYEMLNKIVDDTGEPDLESKSIHYIMPIEKTPDIKFILGEKYFDEITELANKDLDVLLTIMIYKPSAFDDIELGDEIDDKIYQLLKDKLKQAIADENYKLCIDIQEQMEKLKPNS